MDGAENRRVDGHAGDLMEGVPGCKSGVGYWSHGQTCLRFLVKGFFEIFWSITLHWRGLSKFNKKHKRAMTATRTIVTGHEVRLGLISMDDVSKGWSQHLAIWFRVWNLPAFQTCASTIHTTCGCEIPPRCHGCDNYAENKAINCRIERQRGEQLPFFFHGQKHTVRFAKALRDYSPANANLSEWQMAAVLWQRRRNRQVERQGKKSS